MYQPIQITQRDFETDEVKLNPGLVSINLDLIAKEAGRIDGTFGKLGLSVEKGVLKIEPSGGTVIKGNVFIDGSLKTKTESKDSERPFLRYSLLVGN